jgi:K+-transporting ATPase ATPase C chain
MKNIIFSCFRLFLILMILTGAIYPLLVTGIAQVVFRSQANGSLIMANGHAVGSALLSQKTESPRYFWPRPSADDYATVASGASNLGPTSDALKKAIADRAAKLRTASGVAEDAPLPDDMITASASGLDPEISPEAAYLQVPRVARARHLTPDQRQALKKIVEQQIEGPQLGFLGEARVNVLLLNLAVDRIK